MRTFYILVRRELTSFFLSWTGYVIIAAACVSIAQHDRQGRFVCR